MTCDRCLPEQPCLNHEVQARSTRFQSSRNARQWLSENVTYAFEAVEIVARGKARYERNITTGRGM